MAPPGRHGRHPQGVPSPIGVTIAGTDLERIVLALASNAEEYWTTQEIADFVGRSRRQVYRILARVSDPASMGRC
jgi:transcriptional regulator GlxA family with amidase domain